MISFLFKALSDVTFVIEFIWTTINIRPTNTWHGHHRGEHPSLWISLVTDSVKVAKEGDIPHT